MKLFEKKVTDGTFYTKVTDYKILGITFFRDRETDDGDNSLYVSLLTVKIPRRS